MDDIARQQSNASTCLVWALNGGDPDDFFSRVPYEKGFNLLYFLESIVGSEVFESFAVEYINRLHNLFPHFRIKMSTVQPRYLYPVGFNLEQSHPGNSRIIL